MAASSLEDTLDVTSETVPLQTNTDAAGLNSTQSKACRHRQSQRTWCALKKRIGDLPQEMKDAIFEHVVSFNRTEDKIVRITKKYKPPLGLQVNWSSRDKFAKAYYSDSIFLMGFAKHDIQAWGRGGCENNETAAHNICKNWLQSLITSERDLITTIRLEYQPIHQGRGIFFGSRLGQERTADYHASSTLGNLHDCKGGRISLDTGIFCLKLSSDGGEEWYRCKEPPFDAFRSMSNVLHPQRWPMMRFGHTARRTYPRNPPFSMSPAALIRQRLDCEAEWAEADRKEDLKNHVGPSATAHSIVPAYDESRTTVW